jgi:hypothetical protein
MKYHGVGLLPEIVYVVALGYAAILPVSIDPTIRDALIFLRKAFFPGVIHKVAVVGMVCRILTPLSLAKSSKASFTFSVSCEEVSFCRWT